MLAQAELGRPDDFVVLQRYRGPLGALALERRVQRVQVPRSGGGPPGAVLDRSLARATPGCGRLEDPVEEGPEGR